VPAQISNEGVVTTVCHDGTWVIWLTLVALVPMRYRHIVHGPSSDQVHNPFTIAVESE
jgi:hypothetical protein